jgi:hypothetical protein
MEGSLGRGFGQVPGWVRRDPQAVQSGLAESGGKTWQKKIGRTVVAVGSLHRDSSGYVEHHRVVAVNDG